MSKRVLVSPQELSSIFINYLADEHNIFVFSTDIVMNSWIDWCVTHEAESGVSAVPLERFISWDKFKGNYVSASEPGKTPIPALLRKIFVRNLIQKNAKEKFLKKIINPQFADSAVSFTDWICRMLPSLKLWHELSLKASSNQNSNSDFQPDEEDEDYEKLYQHYKSFLQANNFFEPAWATPDFSGSGKKIILIYPELLEDFADYIDVFEKCPDITLIMLPPEDEHPRCIKYKDSRKELRLTILAIRKLVTSGKAKWTDITLNVPELETYRPYLERELTTYCVPFVIRSGFPLTSNCAGVIFNEILNCYNSDFSYDGVRTLLLDNYIPWKEEYTEVKENLIREGQRLRCICNYDDKNGGHIDIWKEALSKINHDEREYTFYMQLKKDITAICKSNSFSAIHVAWMSFKSRYLEASKFSETADKIISRCITELNALIQVEQDFCKPLELNVENPYEFFINELKGKTYTPQNPAAGISVFPYKLSAAADFKYQFVIDSTQNNLEIPFKRLSFLNARKRALLKLTDEDKSFNASKAFIKLYAKNSTDKDQQNLPFFSCAEETFNGFAIAHTYLNTFDEDNFLPLLLEFEKSDFIQNEKKWFLSRNVNELSGGMEALSLSEGADRINISEQQKEQFTRWNSFNQDRTKAPKAYKTPEVLQKMIENFVIENRNKHLSKEQQTEAKITLSQSDMKKFFPCPRKWIFSTVLKLQPDSLSTALIGQFDMGNIHHKILELYGTYLMENNLQLPCYDNEGNLENLKETEEIIEQLTLKAIHNKNEAFTDSPLTIQMLESQIPAITQTIINFLKDFCKKFGGYKVKGVEKWYSGNKAEREWNYTGKIDCILTAGNENQEDTGWTIIDYKNTFSSVPKKFETVVDKNGELADFQMPMYITLIQENEKIKEISLAGFFAINLSTSQNKTIVVDSSKDDTSLDNYLPTIQAFEKYAQRFTDCVKNADYPLTAVDTFENCSICEYKSICRYNYTIAGRTK